MDAVFVFNVCFGRFIPIIPNPLLKAIPSLAKGRCTKRACQMDVNHCQSLVLPQTPDDNVTARTFKATQRK